MTPPPAVDVLSAVEEAEVLLDARQPLEAAEQLQWVTDVSRDPMLLRRVRWLARERAGSTRDAIVATVVWTPLAREAERRLAAALVVHESEH